MEGELRGHKAETAALWESHTKAAAQEKKSHMEYVEEKQSSFLMQLGTVRDSVLLITLSVISQSLAPVFIVI